VRDVSLWRGLLGVEKTVVESVEFDEGDDGDGGGQLLAHVRATRTARGRCGVCRRRCGRYDAGEGRRRWRALDAGTIRVFIEADAPRVRCADHGVVVAHGTTEEVKTSTDPFVSQFIRALPDGPVPFHYPSDSYEQDLELT